MQPKYYFPVNSRTSRPVRNGLAIRNISYDVFCGTYQNICNQLLGQAGMRAEVKQNARQVLAYFRQHAGASTVRFYDAIFGKIYVLQTLDCKIIKEYYCNENNTESTNWLADDSFSLYATTTSLSRKNSTNLNNAGLAMLLQHYGIFKLGKGISQLGLSTEAEAFTSGEGKSM